MNKTFMEREKDGLACRFGTMKQRPSTTTNAKIASFTFIVLIACLYCLPALVAPYWGDGDGWSNLLPVIHYRTSILSEYSLPFYTDLWYGGRYQWQNPLWNFLYLPATLIWLVTPLDWGTRIVLIGHVVFSLLAGKKLASLFLKSEAGSISAAIVLVSPMLPALMGAHIEKILGWGWLLLAVYFIFNENYPDLRRGVYAGLCWGIMALAGDNYHVFYAGILLMPLVLSFKKPALLISFLSGALIGLLHLPSVWYLVGYARADPAQSILQWSMDFLGIFTSLISGLAEPIGLETWALIGLPTVYLFMRAFFNDVVTILRNRPSQFKLQKIALLVSVIILSLMATGTLYQNHHFLDTFRVPARAVALIASAITFYVLISFAQPETVSSERKQKTCKYFWIASALQIAIFSVLFIRPIGAQQSPYDAKATELAEFLKSQEAKSVWVHTTNSQEMYLDVVLTQHQISLPNAYYGDMGQEVTTKGPFCGYAFEYLISPPENNNGTAIKLVSNVTKELLAWMPLTDLQSVDQIVLNSQPYDVHRVICDPKPY